MANVLAELKYSKSHEWVKEEDGLYVIGITDFAQEALGDIVFVNLPEEDDEMTAGEALGDIESVKAVSDIICPVSGKVVEINEDVIDDPAMVNEDAFGAWLIKVADVEETEELLDAEAYEALCAEEE